LPCYGDGDGDVTACPTVFIMSDSDEMALRAKARLAGAIVTRGHAAHPAASANYSKAAEVKTYVDWLLLAHSDFVLATSSSSFSGTALKFRDALAPVPSPMLNRVCKRLFTSPSSTADIWRDFLVWVMVQAAGVLGGEAVLLMPFAHLIAAVSTVAAIALLVLSFVLRKRWLSARRARGGSTMWQARGRLPERESRRRLVV